MVLSFPVQQFYLFLAKIYFYHDARKIDNKHGTLERILYQNVLFLSIASIYLSAGAIEFWICNEEGDVKFSDANGQLEKSILAPAFPNKVKVLA